jgi:hypothetical protein
MADNDSGGTTKGKWFVPMFAGMAVVVAGVALAVGIIVPGDPLLKLKLSIGYALMVLIFLFGFVILAAIATDKIDISELLEEESGGASTSRFQLVIFTFVVGLSFVLIVATNSKFPDVPSSVLVLLGISASTYGVSKGIQAGANNGGSNGTDASPDSTDQGKADQKTDQKKDG